MNASLFIGTYTEPIKFGTGEILEGRGKGIYFCNFDSTTGYFGPLTLAAECRNPSYLCCTADGKTLFAVNELKEYGGEPAGSASAFSICWDGNGPKLHFLGSQSTGGSDPCHISMGEKSGHVYVANFMSGNAAVFPLAQNGALMPYSQLVQHTGSGKDPLRQDGPHAHSVVFTPDGDYLLVPDLGIDKLMVYKVDHASGLLSPAPVPYYSLQAGDGPRFCVFSVDASSCYLIHELASSLSVLAYLGEGMFERKQVVSTLPAGFKGANTCADVHISLDGKFLYASNRGHNSIASYSINPANGELTLIGFVPCGGKTPRNFTVSPCGGYLLVANQDSANLASFSIDPKSGAFEQVDETFAPTPVCICPYPTASERMSNL